MEEAHLLAAAGIVIALQATFLGVLLPLFYTFLSPLVGRILQGKSRQGWRPALEPYARRLEAYYATADTLINLAAVWWSFGILSSIALLVGYFSVQAGLDGKIYGLFMLVALGSLIGTPVASCIVVAEAYRSENLRNANWFCFPSGLSRWWPVFRCLLLVLCLVGMAVAVAAVDIYHIRVQPDVFRWRVDSIFFHLAANGIAATIFVMLWVLLGWCLRPIQAAQAMDARIDVS